MAIEGFAETPDALVRTEDSSLTVETKLTIAKPVLAGMLLLAAVVATAGQSYKHFPGVPLDERLLRTQERVEELYDQGEYERALLIYKEDLAPKGDKFAQYCVGYMYLNGQGVTQDNARALAWYRLAAERGATMLVQARDNLLRQLGPGEIAESNRIFAELWRQMGDNSILLGLIRADINTLKARTGSRIPGAASGPLTVLDVAGSGVAAERFYQSVENRLQTRLDYLKNNVEIVDVNLGEEDDVVRDLENDMKRALASLELP